MRMRRAFIFLPFLVLQLVLFSSIARAEEGTTPAAPDNGEQQHDEKSLSKDTLLWIATLEGSAALMSKLAADRPRAYGNILIFTSPLFAAMAGPKNKTDFILGTLFLAGMGAYNLSIADKGKSTIFRNNMILYNTIFLPAIAYVVYKELHTDSKHSTRIIPAALPDGAMLFVSRAF